MTIYRLPELCVEGSPRFTFGDSLHRCPCVPCVHPCRSIRHKSDNPSITLGIRDDIIDVATVSSKGVKSM